MVETHGAFTATMPAREQGGGLTGKPRVVAPPFGFRQVVEASPLKEGDATCDRRSGKCGDNDSTVSIIV